MLELADVLRRFGAAYRARFDRLPGVLARAMAAIEQCRTEVLGGQVWRCDNGECATDRYTYHSCRHRACPKCHSDQTRAWLARTLELLLPTPHLLVTFTLPAALRPLARRHRRVLLRAILGCSCQAVLALARDPAWLGATPAVMAFLHTWTRDLRWHPHVHLLMTAGGLAADGRWVRPCKGAFFVPQAALAKTFRGRLQKALRDAKLAHFAPLGAWDTPWVVHVHPSGDGHRVLGYLARYVHRVALANSRLVGITGSTVTFRYRSSRSGEMKLCSLPSLQFIARFMQHVPPPHLPRLRYAGLLAPGKRDLLERARGLLASPHPRQQPPQATPPREHRCPVCHSGTLRLIGRLPPRRAPP